jgi:hypothetical protein
MAYVFQNSNLGMPAITFHGQYAPGSPQRTPPWKLGDIQRAVDPTYGAGEFILLKGVANTVVGSVVNYDDSFQTALNTTGLSTPRPVAVAMAATVANEYGWYQIGGLAVVAKANSVSFAKGAALAVATGKAIAAASGLILNGALVAVVASAKSDVTSVKVMVNRPHDPSDVS